MRSKDYYTVALAALALCFAGYGRLSAQWQSVGPGNGPTRAVAAYTAGGVNYLFAGSVAGLYRSTNNGLSWTVAAGFPADELGQIRGEGKYVFAAPLNGGLYRSTDYGGTWTQVSVPILDVSHVSGIAIDSNLVLATTYGSGPFVSYDFGSTWTADDSGLTHLQQTAPLLIPLNRLSPGSRAPGPKLAGLSYDWAWIVDAFGKGDTVHMRTTTLPRDTGAATRKRQWDTLVAPLLGPTKDTEVLFPPDGSDIKKVSGEGTAAFSRSPLIFVAAFDAVYRTTDSGATWLKRSPENFPEGIAIKDTEVYAGYLNSGVYSSTDYGSTWLRDTLGLPNHSVSALAASDSGLYAATDNGIARLVQRGGRWTDISTKLNVQEVVALFADSSTLFCSTFNLANLRSTNGGAQWRADMTGLSVEIGTYEADSTYHYAGSIDGNGAFRSSDGGIHWEPIITGLYPNGGQIVQLLRSRGRLYAGTVSGGVYVTTDQGDHWAQSNAGLPESNPGSIYIQAFGATDSVLFAVVGNHDMFRSTDGGATWVPSDTSFHLATLALCLQSSGRTMYAGILGKGVYKTTDRGLSWQPAAAGIKNETVTAMAASGTMIFAGCEDGKIYGSANGGASWSDVGQGYIGAKVDYLVVQGGMLYAGTAGASVWRRPLSEVTLGVAEGAQAALPAGFRLEQNYPNPFNPATLIGYALPARSHVTLTVFNILGQQVSELVNGDEEAGHHEARFDASQLASGVYFYRLSAIPAQKAKPGSGDFTQIRAMVMVR